jgi:hypothetical protein
MELPLEAGLTVVIGLAALCITALQLFLDHRSRTRQRDAEMTCWGVDVIDVMAAIETECLPLAADYKVEASSFDQLGARASALVDRGRLFFPNVGLHKGRPDDEGTRVKVLDEVLRACYVARHCAVHGAAGGEVLRGQVWDARRRFVRLLQAEMSASLRRVGADSAGDHISKTP